MLKVYYLRQLKNEVIDTEYTEGSEYISRAICEATEEPGIRRVIIEEKSELAAIALRVEEPTNRDIENYNSLPEIGVSRDLAKEIDELKARIAKLEEASPPPLRRG